MADLWDVALGRNSYRYPNTLPARRTDVANYKNLWSYHGRPLPRLRPGGPLDTKWRKYRARDWIPLGWENERTLNFVSNHWVPNWVKMKRFAANARLAYSRRLAQNRYQQQQRIQNFRGGIFQRNWPNRPRQNFRRYMSYYGR